MRSITLSKGGCSMGNKLFQWCLNEDRKDAELQRQSVHCESKDPHGDAAPQSGLTCTSASRTSGVGEALRINCVAVLHGVGGQVCETEDCLSLEEREAARVVCTATAVLTGDPASDHAST